MPISVLAIDIGDSELLSALQGRGYTLDLRQMGELFSGPIFGERFGIESFYYAAALLNPNSPATSWTEEHRNFKRVTSCCRALSQRGIPVVIASLKASRTDLWLNCQLRRGRDYYALFGRTEYNQGIYTPELIAEMIDRAVAKQPNPEIISTSN